MHTKLQKEGVLLVVSVGLLVLFLSLYLKGSSLVETVNHAGAVGATILHSSTLTYVMFFVTTLGEVVPALLFGMLLVLIFLLRQDYVTAFFITTTLSIGTILLFILKEIIAAPRPVYALFLEESYAFPSGHATIAVLFAVILALVFSPHALIKKYIFQIFLALFAALIGLSRVYFGVHTIWDIATGFLLALSVAVLCKVFTDLLVPRLHRNSSPSRSELE